MSFRTPTNSFIPIPVEAPPAPKSHRSLREDMDVRHAELMLSLSPDRKRARTVHIPSAHRQSIFDTITSPHLPFVDYIDNVIPVLLNVLLVFGNVVGVNGQCLWRVASEGTSGAFFPSTRNPFVDILINLMDVWGPIMRNCQACFRMNQHAHTDLNDHHMHLKTTTVRTVVNSVQNAYDLVGRGPLTRYIIQNMVTFVHPKSKRSGFKFDTFINACGFFDADEVWDDCVNPNDYFHSFREEDAYTAQTDGKIFTSFYDHLVPQYLEQAIKDVFHNKQFFQWSGKLRMPPPRPSHLSAQHEFSSGPIRVHLENYYDPSQYFFTEIDTRGHRFIKYNMAAANVGVVFLLHAFFRSQFRYVPTRVMACTFVHFTCDFFHRLWSGDFECLPTRVLPRFPLALHAYIYGTCCLPSQCVALQSNFRAVYSSRLGIRKYERYFITDLCVGLVWMLHIIEGMMDDFTDFFHVNLDDDGTWYEMDNKRHYLMTNVCIANFLAVLRLFFLSVFDPKDYATGPERVSGINIDEFCVGIIPPESFLDTHVQWGLLEVLIAFNKVALKSRTGKYYFPYAFPYTPRLQQPAFSASGDLFGVIRSYFLSGMAKDERPAEPRVIDLSLCSILENLNNRTLSPPTRARKAHPWLKFDVARGEFETGPWCMEHPGEPKRWARENQEMIHTELHKLFMHAFEGTWGSGVEF